MNKRKIDQLLPKARQAIIEIGISEDQVTVSSTFRGYISSFGAAVYNGSLLAAIAFFNQQKSAKDDRPKLMQAIHQMLGSEKKDLFEHAETAQTPAERRKMKADILNCAIALKLAMNLFELKKEKGAPE